MSAITPSPHHTKHTSAIGKISHGPALQSSNKWLLLNYCNACQFYLNSLPVKLIDIYFFLCFIHRDLHVTKIKILILILKTTNFLNTTPRHPPSKERYWTMYKSNLSLNPKQSRVLISKESHKCNSIDSQRNRVVIFLLSLSELK